MSGRWRWLPLPFAATGGPDAIAARTTPDHAWREAALGFVHRIWRLRMLGLGLGVWPVAAVLYERDAHAIAWVALAMHGYAWPHIALLLARNSADPRAAELRNLMVDSAMGGVWIALMAFNLVPSALLAALLSADKIGVAGWRFLARTATLMVVACALVSALTGFPVALQSSIMVVIAALPFLFAYPMAISTASFHLSRKVVRQNRQLERMNRIDVLTGLPNRRHWNEVAGSELARFLRTRRPAAALLLDVDNFKEVNDSHGHAVGDDVLCCVAGVLCDSIREIDTAVRYGGDEFAVLLAETDARGAREVAERIRRRFLEMRSREAASLHCTLSIGVAEADRLLMSAEDWLQRADAAMYAAKAEGRNRVVVECMTTQRSP